LIKGSPREKESILAYVFSPIPGFAQIWFDPVPGGPKADEILGRIPPEKLCPFGKSIKKRGGLAVF
jgi:hypothetical protein